MPQLIAKLYRIPSQDTGVFALFCGFGLVALAAFVLWVWCLIDAIRNPRLSDNNRLIWVLVIVLVGPLGALIYLLAGRG